MGVDTASKAYRVRVTPVGKAAAKEREIECADDGAILLHCFSLLADWHDAEAWDGDRLVCRLTRPKGSEPRSS